MARRDDGMWIGVLFAFVGAGLLLAALADAGVTWRFVQRAQRVSGKVTGLYAGAAHPRIEFTTPEGAQVTIAGTGFVHHRPGDRVELLFPGDAPERAQLDEPGALWFSAVMTGLLGMALLVGGLVKLGQTG